MDQRELSQKALELRQSNLSADILPSVESIAAYLYGEANKSTVRRIRHLIATAGFPAKKVGGKIEGRRSWCDSYYSTPDNAAPGNGGA
jgi:hypothetical protein